jgi:hypothetical protein
VGDPQVALERILQDLFEGMVGSIEPPPHGCEPADGAERTREQVANGDKRNVVHDDYLN